MGNVICIYEILPDSPESLGKVKKGLEELKPESIEEVPIAFGLKSLTVKIVIPEEDGALDSIENKLNDIDGVTSVELKHSTRAL